MFTKHLTPVHLMNSWQKGNAIILILSLLLPWKIAWFDIPPYSVFYIHGFDVLISSIKLIRWSLVSQGGLPSDFSPLLSWNLFEAFVPLVAIGYSVYCMVAFFSHASAGSRSWKRSILLLLMLLLVAYPLWHVSYGVGFHNQLSWGYYMAILGFVTSALFELVSMIWFRVRQRNPENQSEVPEAG